MVCFVAIEENNDESSDTEVKDDNPLYDELCCAFEEMYEDMQRL